MAKKTVKAKTAMKKPVPAKTKKNVKKTILNPGVKAKPILKAKPGIKAKPAGVVKSATKANPVVKVKTTGKPVSVKAKIPHKSPLDKKSLEGLKEALIKMRDRLSGQISAIADDSLKYIDDASSEDRTDDFDREFALNLVSSEHDNVFEIDNALRRIEEGAYGLCDGCGCAIEKPRLQALPFARMCVKCQSEQEKGRSRFRPFGDTIAQGVEQAPDVVEPEESE